MQDCNLLTKVALKLKNEGLGGVISAVLRRVHPFVKGLTKPRDKGGAYHLLYVIGCSEGESKRYRVYNIIEALRPLGVTAKAVSPEELAYQKPELYSLVVFFRCELSAVTKAFLARCTAVNVPTVFDVDDLIFDETITDQIAAVQDMNMEYQRLYITGVKRYREMLEMCDYATASTEYLCEYIRKLTNKPVWKIPNGVNKEQITSANQCQNSSICGNYTIGYLSGSKTHQKDFAQTAKSIAKIMLEFPKINLRIIGYLDIPECLKPFAARINQQPFMPYLQLLQSCSDLYAVVVPLEYETAFCQAKSELKYFEQALLGIPVIVSPTQPFLSCIVNGKNGLFAKNEQEWYQAIKLLLSDKALRDRMGQAAQKQIKDMFYPEQVGIHTRKAYDEMQFNFTRATMQKEHLRVAFVIPEPLKGAGGHRNLFRAARAFAQQGHQVTIYTDGFTGRLLSDKALERFVTENFFDTGAHFVLGCENIKRCDILIATQWHTAYVVRQYRHRCILPCYFIQDFEPYFYPMGEEYVQAYATYSFGFAQIASGKWAAEMTEKVSGRHCPYFDFPLQREIYYPDNKVEREINQVLFFARPQMPRRCYMLGVEALRLLKQKKPQVQIVFYGDDTRQYGDYGFDYEKAGILGGPEDLARYYRSATVGLCFSVTNPSLVPYEMMACGLPVVDVDFNSSSASYNGYETVLLSEPTPQQICDNLMYLINNPKEADRRRQNGYALVSAMPTEEEMEKVVVEIISKYLNI